MRSEVRFGSAALLLASVLFVGGCSSAPQQSERAVSTSTVGTVPVATEPTPSIEVTIAPVVKIRNGVMRVTGTTDLVDGASLNWEVGRWSDGSGESFKSGTATVKNGRFAYSADVGSIPGRQVYAFTLFASGDQPASVRAAYGEYGENLGGPGVYDQGKYRMLETWVVVDR